MKRSDKKIKIELLSWIFMLTMLSGALNAYAIRVLGNPATHHTGNSTLLAISLCENPSLAKSLFILLLSFFFGATLSGIIFHDVSLGTKKRYGLLLVFAGLFLALADSFFPNSLKLYSISFWIGMQNAMFIRYDGILVRTSHMTGYLTDAGLALGAYLRGINTGAFRIKFYLFSIFCFIFGGVLGCFIMSRFAFSLSLMGALYIVCGAYYFLISKKMI